MFLRHGPFIKFKLWFKVYRFPLWVSVTRLRDFFLHKLSSEDHLHSVGPYTLPSNYDVDRMSANKWREFSDWSLRGSLRVILTLRRWPFTIVKQRGNSSKELQSEQFIHDSDINPLCDHHLLVHECVSNQVSDPALWLYHLLQTSV